MRKIIIFGTSSVGERAFHVISLLSQFEIIAWTDNDEKKWQKTKYGLKIIPPKELKEYKDVYIVIGSSYFIEISEQLNNMGITDYCKDIHHIIADLNKEQRIHLKENLVSSVLDYVNIDYQTKELKKIESKLSTGKEEGYLVICNGGYPSNYDLIQSCAFVHRRVKYYQINQLHMEVYAYRKNESFETDKYDGVQVYRGDFWGLVHILEKKKYKKILIHFLTKEVWSALCIADVIDIPMVIWCHGSEIENWHLQWPDYANTIQKAEEERDKLDREDKKKKNLFKEVFSKENIFVVFVSEWIKNRAIQIIGIEPIHYQVIHNIIDENLFVYSAKTIDERKKIISIKAHATYRYANDIVAKAINELSYRRCFNDLSIYLAGDGGLFDENFYALKSKKFRNVTIEQKFFRQEELSILYRQYGIFLSPTRSDTQGVTNGEAMSSGLNVITCNTAAIPEFVDDECGLLYEYDNYLQMADQIEFLYYNPDEFLRRSKKAAERVRKQCGYESTVAKEIELIKRDDFDR